jgi:mRNA-decapping enzyme subunit 2
MDSVKHKEYKIPFDILDDLASRFIINVPEEVRSNFIRICFQVELAHWFYLDFYCGVPPYYATQCGIKHFALQLFNHVPFLTPHVEKLPEILNEFNQYKRNVPTYGAILMNSDLDKVLLVQSYWAKSSWGFPKGKVNESEEPIICAIREVYEETGYDITKLIKADMYIERELHDQTTRLYIVQNVPTETVFAPRTRMEIKSCEWFSLEHLPTHKTDTICKTHLGINANSFFMIMPFVKRLKRFLLEQCITQDVDTPAENQHQKNKKNVNGGTGNGNGNGSTNVSKRRQRHKSLGDLDGVKPLSGAPIAFQQQGKVSTTPGNLNVAVAANGKRNKIKQNLKRQLFTADGADFGLSSQYFFDDNANVTPQSHGKSTNGKTIISKYTRNSSHKKSSLVPIDDFVDSDPFIEKWKHFTFDLSKLLTF